MLSKSSYLGKKKQKVLISKQCYLERVSQKKLFQNQSSYLKKKKAQKFLFLGSLVHAAVKQGPSPRPHRVMERIKCHHVDQN